MSFEDRMKYGDKSTSGGGIENPLWKDNLSLNFICSPCNSNIIEQRKHIKLTLNHVVVWTECLSTVSMPATSSLHVVWMIPLKRWAARDWVAAPALRASICEFAWLECASISFSVIK